MQCLKHLKIDHLFKGVMICVREASASCRLVCLWLLKRKCVSAGGIRGSAFLFHVWSESVCLQSDRIVLGQQKGLHHRSVWNATQQCVAAGLRNVREIYREKKLISMTGSFVYWKAWLSLSRAHFLSIARAHEAFIQSSVPEEFSVACRRMQIGFGWCYFGSEHQSRYSRV